MNSFRKNKLVLGLLLTAVLGFAVLSIGGEYLHSRIHKHETQASHQQCPIYQVQTHAFTAVGAVLTALFIKIALTGVVCRSKFFVFQSSYILPESHAPPFSLL